MQEILTQQVCIAQTLHIPKKILSSGLNFDHLLGDNLWAL